MSGTARPPHQTVVYQVDPEIFLDTEGHGWGTLDGITAKLDYLAGLGVTTLWLLPFFLSGHRDEGYDVTDHCAIDPRTGDEAAFARLVRAAADRGMDVVVELIMQHTSDLHPWFQSALHEAGSPYRAWYLFRDAPEPDSPAPIFPPIEPTVWRWDAEIRQYYRHRFYAHEPDLELAHPDVRAELARIMRFWLDRGVAGFRIDALPYMVERAALADAREDGLWLIEEMRRIAAEHHDAPYLIGEADVPADHYGDYVRGGARLSHMLDFNLNNHLFLALARGDARELVETLHSYDKDAPPATRMAWLRNNDELDLERLTEAQRAEVMDAFAPEAGMRIYRRGIRRRLPPMLGGGADRIAMAHALLLSLGQVPVLRFGEEIGMGDELELPERHSVRTPMQWHDGKWAGFTKSDAPWRSPIDRGPFDYRRVNVATQEGRADSVLERTRALLLARRGLAAFDRPVRFSTGGDGGVLVGAFGADGGSGDAGSELLVLVNLSSREQMALLPEAFIGGEVVIAHGATFSPTPRARLARYGYAWVRASA